MSGMAADTLFAVECSALPSLGSRGYNSTSPKLATTANLSGQHDERAIPRQTVICAPTRKSAGFVEGNRGIPQPRCDHGPALGETRGDARSPPRARPQRIGVRVRFGARCLVAKPQTAFG